MLTSSTDGGTGGKEAPRLHLSPDDDCGNACEVNRKKQKETCSQPLTPFQLFTRRLWTGCTSSTRKRYIDKVVPRDFVMVEVVCRPFAMAKDRNLAIRTLLTISD